MKYKIRNLTPEEMSCFIAQCPAIYEGTKELTPQDMDCIIGQCPEIYSSKNKEVYLIIGKIINPSEAGLEGKVGKDECLIEVPKDLIDKMRK